MQLALLLSDLTSLRACDPAAARALVSQRPSSSSTQASRAGATELVSIQAVERSNPDLNRPAELLQLRTSIKSAYTSPDPELRDQTPQTLAELQDARQEVRRALARLGLQRGFGGESHVISTKLETMPVHKAVQRHDNTIIDPMDEMDDEEVAAWS